MSFYSVGELLAEWVILRTDGKANMDLGESLDSIARATLDGYLRGACGLAVPGNIGVPFYVFDARNVGDAGVRAKFVQILPVAPTFGTIMPSKRGAQGTSRTAFFLGRIVAREHRW